MTRWMRVLGWIALGGLLLGVALVAAGMAAAGPLGHAVIEIDGAQFHLADLHGGQWLAASAGALLALLVVAVVVPVALLVPVLVLAVLLLALLAVLAGVAALLFSPVLIGAAAVWLVWRLVRSKKQRESTPAATIAG